MKAEPYLVVLIYGLLISVGLLSGLLVYGFIWIKHYLQENRKFTRLMIKLYEQAEEKNQRTDEGGFGT